MNTDIERPSAVIYQFPVRPRGQADSRSAIDLVPAYEAVAIDGWYHADAIRQSEPVRRT